MAKLDTGCLGPGEIRRTMAGRLHDSWLTIEVYLP